MESTRRHCAQLIAALVQACGGGASNAAAAGRGRGHGQASIPPREGCP